MKSAVSCDIFQEKGFAGKPKIPIFGLVIQRDVASQSIQSQDADPAVMSFIHSEQRISPSEQKSAAQTIT